MSTIANFALIWAYVKNMPGWLFWACLPLHLAMKLVTTVVFVMCGNGRGILRAKCDALLGLPKMRRKRQEIQKGACCFLPVCVRKPWPGMILQVAGEFNVDLAKSVVVGDKETDIQAGVAGGGGFMMFFVAPEKRMNAIRTLNSFDGQVSNCHFTKYGSQAWRV